MSGDYSDGEGSVGHEADFVDATADMEVDLCLPLEVDMPPDQLRNYVPTYSGAVDPSAVDLGQEERRRFEPPDGAKSKWPRHGLPVPGATAHLVSSGAGRHRLGAADPTYPGLAQRQQNTGIKTPTLVEFGRGSGFPG